MRRRIIHRADESVVVDLVRDQVKQGDPVKMQFGGIAVDPPAEILANKLTALLARSEPRDLVDVMALEEAGHRVDDAFDLAIQKDGGLTPAQLGWILSQIKIPDGAELPGGVEAADLRDYLHDLELRLSRMAFPG
jgi:nitrogen fixation protein